MKIKKDFFTFSKTKLLKFGERFLIEIYGGEENAKRAIIKINESKNDIERRKNILNIPYFKTIRTLYKRVFSFNNFTSLLKNIKTLKKHQIDKEELENLSDLSQKLQPNVFQLLDTNEKIFPIYISDKIKFSKKEIREEVGFKKQKVFYKWLSLWKINYKDKNDFTLIEYVKIIEKCLLEEDESFRIDFNLEVFLERIEKGLIFNQTRLRKINKKDYKTYKKHINFLKEEGKFPQKSRNFPYSIAIEILNSLNHH